MLMNRLGFGCLSLGAVLLLADCHGNPTSSPPPTPVVNRIVVLPDSLSLAIGLSQPLSAWALDASGDTVAGAVINWTSNADTVAAVDQHGIVTAVLPGTARISASAAGKTGVSVVTVPPAAIASVSLTPNSGFFEIGETVTIIPTVKDILGHTVTIPIVWQSNSPAVATVTREGMVIGLATGPVRITADANGVLGIADLTIIPMSVFKVTVTPQNDTLFVGETTPLSARVESARGDLLTDRPVIWRSKDEFIASVSTSGGITAVSPGDVWVVAESEGVRDSALVTVSLRPPEGYDVEIVNHLLLPVQVAINGVAAMTLPPGATFDIFLPPEPTVRVAWALIAPTDAGEPIGEEVTDTFPQAAGPNGARLHFEVGATLTDGRRLLTPALKNTSGATVLVSFGLKETVVPCSCILQSGLAESTDFGYWFLRDGQTLRLYGRSDAAHTGPFLAIPVPPGDVDPLTGIWHFLVTSGP